jgi:hypothetical protein
MRADYTEDELIELHANGYVASFIRDLDEGVGVVIAPSERTFSGAYGEVPLDMGVVVRVERNYTHGNMSFIIEHLDGIRTHHWYSINYPCYIKYSDEIKDVSDNPLILHHWPQPQDAADGV